MINLQNIFVGLLMAFVGDNLLGFSGISLFLWIMLCMFLYILLGR